MHNLHVHTHACAPCTLYMHALTHDDGHLCISSRMLARTHACMHAHTHTRTHARTRMCISTHARTHTCMHKVSMYARTLRTHRCTHTHAGIHACVKVCTHAGIHACLHSHSNTSSANTRDRHAGLYAQLSSLVKPGYWIAGARSSAVGATHGLLMIALKPGSMAGHLSSSATSRMFHR